MEELLAGLWALLSALSLEQWLNIIIVFNMITSAVGMASNPTNRLGWISALFGWCVSFYLLNLHMWFMSIIN